MKNYLIALLSAAVLAAPAASAQERTDSVDMLAYAKINGASGMRIAWRADAREPWQPLNNYTFVSSDYGAWGSHKKMLAPVLANDGSQWVLTWIADIDNGVAAQATSQDLIYWMPQTYAMSDGRGRAVEQHLVGGEPVLGSQLRVPVSLVEGLQAYVADREALQALWAETAADVADHLAAIGPVSYTITAQPKQAKDISDMFIGIFFEDINYGADGGLYAELLQNRDFEYLPSDRGNDRNWNALKAWSFPKADLGTSEVRTADPIHPNNPHYLHVAAKPGYEVANAGYDGIAVKAGESYDFSMRLRGKGAVKASLVGNDGKVLAQSPVIAIPAAGWQEVGCTLTPSDADADCRLVVTAAGDAEYDMDMVSLFPQQTFKGRKNGLRADLAQTLADLHPRFVRFPGGCVAHGDGIDNIYDWKGSIGPLEARKPLRNLWGYHQTRGLGYHEYFLFCEDIGAEPLPVLAAGVPCQNSSTPSHYSHDAVTTGGQQCGIPLDDMGAYIQDVLDLIEYANGPADTEWGAKRAAAGHPEPFNLKYIGIGNEDMITEVFVPRFKMIYDAVRAAHPEVQVVGTVGPFYEGTDYEEGWKLAHELSIPYVDEHYYVSPGWLVYNQDYYDDYRRGATEVYLGEWACHLPGRPNNVETAITEALYLTSVERNADVVAMTSYAPLLAKKGHTQWNPDLIYFTNTEVMPTVGYYTQQLYGLNSGDKYIPATATLSTHDPKATPRVGSSIVRDSATGEYIVKLVNLLPVEVDATADLSKLPVKAGKAQGWLLTGEIADTQATPQAIVIDVSKTKKMRQILPPYSFTVVRISPPAP